MNYLDIIIIVLVAIGTLVGLYKGLVREVAGLVALVAGIIGARAWAGEVLVRLNEHVAMDERWGYLVAWVLCFLGIALVVNVIGWLLTRALEAVALGCVNKLLGGIFGGIKYILLFSVLFNLIGLVSEYVSIPGEQARRESKLYGPIREVAAWSNPSGPQGHLPYE